MKVLLYSHYFYPALGGLETVSLTLAEGFISEGIACKVVTTSVGDNDRAFPFEVIRNPSVKLQIELIKWADVVLFNGASLALQPWLLLFRKPFLWVHVGYQVSCIDGLGWVEGQQAPIRPFASFVYHSKRKGWVWGVKEGLKLGLRRFVAKYLVSKNIAITEWMNKIQPLPRQVHIYNPFPIDQFLNSDKTLVSEYEFVYLGRIVSEKGLPTLLKAFSIVINMTNPVPRLLIIGDGKWKDKMEALAIELNIVEHVTFVGKNQVENSLN